MVLLQWTRQVAFIATLFTTLGVCVSAQLHPQSQSRSDEISKPDVQQAKPTQTQPSPEQRGTDTNPLIVRESRSERQAAEDVESKQDERKNRRYGLWLSAITTLVIAVQVWLLIRQNTIIGAQNDILGAQKALMQSQTTTLDDTLVANKAIERAYIDLSHAPPGLRPDKDGGFLISMVMKNNGHTPGDVLGGRIWLSMTDKPGFQWARVIQISTIPCAFINPSERLTLGDIKVEVTPEALAKTLTTWIAGEIYYRDRFEGIHEAGYGRRYFQGLAANNLVFDGSTTGMNYDRPVENPTFDQFGEFQIPKPTVKLSNEGEAQPC